MNSVFLPSSLLLHAPALRRSAFCIRPQPQYNFCRNNHQRLCSLSLKSPVVSCHSLRHRHLSTGVTSNEGEGAVAVFDFQDFPEKDWSFLETGDVNSDEELKRKINLILTAGEIEEASRVLVSIGSEGFVDQIMNSLTCLPTTAGCP